MTIIKTNSLQRDMIYEPYTGKSYFVEKRYKNYSNPNKQSWICYSPNRDDQKEKRKFKNGDLQLFLDLTKVDNVRHKKGFTRLNYHQVKQIFN